MTKEEFTKHLSTLSVGEKIKIILKLPNIEYPGGATFTPFAYSKMCGFETVIGCCCGDERSFDIMKFDRHDDMLLWLYDHNLLPEYNTGN